MKTELELNELILGITNKIRDNHPELLEDLNSVQITVPYQETPQTTVDTLKSYYHTLVNLLEKYEDGLSKNIVAEKIKTLPITEIITMELENSYQNLYTETNNFTLSYNDIGEGEIPIIFLHGYPFDKSMWIGQLDSLKSSYRLITCDIRGFGKSTDETTPLRIDLFSEDLLSFMDKLKIPKAILCGLSMGGFIALNAIKRFPDRFEALILCDTQCIADTDSIKENRYIAIEQINLNGPNDFNEKFVKSVFHPNSLLNEIELVKSLRSIVFTNSKHIISAGLIALAERSETCSTLGDIHVPTLIICGREDIVTPLVQSEFMHKHITGSILKIIENAGHVSNLEHPDEFNNCLSDFLSSLSRVSKKDD